LKEIQARFVIICLHTKTKKAWSISMLRDTLAQKWEQIQGSLFPWLSEEIGELNEKQQQLINILELLRIEHYVYHSNARVGRKENDRTAIARAFVAKAVYNMSTTRLLIDRLHSDIKMRRICGWERRSDIPEEWTFSRAFSEFSNNRLTERVQEALIRDCYKEDIVGHISRDSTAIEAREKPEKKVVKKSVEIKRKPGRPKHGEKVPKKEKRRIEKQISASSLKEMLDDLPKACNVGTKKNSKGKISHWIGYKLHIDAADGGIPISCLLTSASTHDSQVSIPLGEMSHKRVTSLYDLMDAAYDVPEIHEHSKNLGHIPIIDKNARRDKALKLELEAEIKRTKKVGYKTAEAIRYNERSTVERVNGRLKDEFSGRMVRVRGPEKVMCHLMFGILALTADQLLKFVT